MAKLRPRFDDAGIAEAAERYARQMIGNGWPTERDRKALIKGLIEAGHAYRHYSAISGALAYQNGARKTIVQAERLATNLLRLMDSARDEFQDSQRFAVKEILQTCETSLKWYKKPEKKRPNRLGDMALVCYMATLSEDLGRKPGVTKPKDHAKPNRPRGAFLRFVDGWLLKIDPTRDNPPFSPTTADDWLERWKARGLPPDLWNTISGDFVPKDNAGK